MNRKFLVLAVIAICLTGLILGSCSSTPKFSAAMGKDWKLIDVQISGDPFSRRIRYDRDKLKAEGIDDIFILKFNSTSLNGVGARNTYSAPYTIGENLSIEVQDLNISTYEPIVRPEKLQEQEYFVYVKNIAKWTINKEKKLVLTSKAEDGNTVRLTFTLK